MLLIYLQNSTILTPLTNTKQYNTIFSPVLTLYTMRYLHYKDKVTLTLLIIQLALRQITTYELILIPEITFHTAYSLKFNFYITAAYFSARGHPSTGSISFQKS